MNRLRLVVARYQEKLDWLRSLTAISSRPDIWIYNKGTPGELSDLHGVGGVFVQDVPNRGREAETYLRYLEQVGHSTAVDGVAFIQGNPLDHCPDLNAQLKAWIDRPVPWMPLGHYCTCDVNGMPQHLLPIAKSYAQFFPTPPDGPRSFTFVVGAQFIVSAERLRARKLEDYQKLRSFVDREAVPGERFSPIEPYIMERLWPAVF